MPVVVKNLPVNAGDTRDVSWVPELGRSPGVEVATTPVFLSGESHGQRSLAGYSPWGPQRVRHNWVSEHLIFYAEVMFTSNTKSQSTCKYSSLKIQLYTEKQGFKECCKWISPQTISHSPCLIDLLTSLSWAPLNVWGFAEQESDFLSSVPTSILSSRSKGIPSTFNVLKGCVIMTMVEHSWFPEIIS